MTRPRPVLVPAGPGYADELRRVRRTPAVRAWWGEPGDGDPPRVEPDTTVFAVPATDPVIGLVQCAEETDLQDRCGSTDTFLDPVGPGLGCGREAVRPLVDHLVPAGSVGR